MIMKIRKTISLIMAVVMAVSVTAWGSETGSPDETVTEAAGVRQTASMSEAQTNLAKIDNTSWQYNAEDDVYYQIGISYCENPADASYETLAVFVPGAYMTATDNGNGTYTCEINSGGSIGSYTADTAPIVIPVNTPGYSAMAPLSSYSSFTEYTNEGFVYVHAGCRGRDAGAPAGVTDLKAAVRYIRYTDDVLPGDAESIFTFGMSGGGAQSALMGSTGDSDLYNTYLEEIGAVMGVSDAVLGSMCWCPITNLDTADEAYEWMMGVTRNGLSEEEQLISDKLAEAFAAYINLAGLKDEDGNVLTLSESSDGIYQSGTYYDYMKTVIEESLNNFLSDTEFPYDASASGGMMGGPGGGMRGGHGGMTFGNGDRQDGERPDFGDGDGPDFGEYGRPDGEGATPFGEEEMSGDMTAAEDKQPYEAMDDITRNESTGGLSLSGTYETAQDYIDALNADGEWVIYDASANNATITSIEDFVMAFKSASKNIGAFDQLDEGQGENTLFGYGDGDGAHFDAVLAQILTDLGSSYASAYAEDLTQTDDTGNTVDVRLNMYTPLYYLLESSEGYETSTVAKYWRIRTGIAQSDCALSTEINLALALENYSGIENVDFETVWGAGHTQAERTGSSTDNFIAWVNECMSEE
ncbi:MAG: tannase [Blautia sp.]|nr:tannase [Blautia sp.]